MTASIVKKDLLTALQERRTIYAISKASPISDEEIESLLSAVVKHTPSAFNSQSTRLVLLLGEQHDKLWDLAKNALQAIQPEEQFRATLERLNGFRDGYGTVLFFEDPSIIESLQAKFPKAQERFPLWSEQTNAMHQYATWVTLEAYGFGASLQHYNPFIDEQVKITWNLPENWRLIAQMPFGQPSGSPREKEYQPLEERLKIFK